MSVFLVVKTGPPLQYIAIFGTPLTRLTIGGNILIPVAKDATVGLVCVYQ